MPRNYSQERIASLIQREIVDVVNEVIKIEKIGFINITDVRLSVDKSIATIYYTILSEDKNLIKRLAQELNKNIKTIRVLLTKRLRDLRRSPELIFKYDNSLAYGNKIEKIIKEIKEIEKKAK